MAVLEQQISADVGGLARSGATVRASNFNSKIVTVFDEERGTINFPATSVQLSDDFLGGTLSGSWSVNHGTDGQALDPAINSQVGGVVRLTAGDTVTVAESLSSLTHGLNWKANQGGLYLEARIKAPSVENVCVNVGFSDALSTTSLEEPITLSGTTLTTNATDAAVFVFDTAATNDTLHIQGVKNGTDTALNNTGQTLSADVWVKLAVAIDSSGNAEFFIDDQSYGVVANAVTATVALTPIFTVMARTTTVKTLDVDYALVAAARA
jgi:hypothetical protein